MGLPWQQRTTRRCGRSARQARRRAARRVARSGGAPSLAASYDAALFSHRPGMVLGFEMFPRRVQPVLDRWSKGELNEADFLRQVDWPQIWGFADTLYL